MSKRYKVNRKKLIEHYPHIIFSLTQVNDNMKEDLIKGGEFILSAQNILDNINIVKGYVLEPPILKNVSSKDCEIIYLSQ